MEILQIKNLSFSYPDTDKPAINDINLSIEAGEFCFICGESGCGKTTLLRLLKRELAPFGNKKGEIIYKGTELQSLDSKTAACHIGFVLQNPDSQIVTDTVWHELAFGLESLGYSSGAIRRRVAEMASYFGIEGWFRKKTAELSGGQKQMLNLASVMAMSPKVLLLDEPTAQLDPIAASGFINTLYKLNRELGVTVLIVEHRLEEIMPLADKMIIMDKGSLVFADKPRRISDFLESAPEHPVAYGLPAAMRIYFGLEKGCAPPLTVREGRKYLIDNYVNEKAFIEEIPYTHSNEKVVQLSDIWFRYSKELPDVVRGVNLDIYKGEHLCILGGNGAGKTTVLSLIAGLYKPYRGKIKVEGENIRDYKNNSLYINNIALLPQNPQTVFLENTLYEDLRETCRTMKYNKEEASYKIKDCAKMLSIEELLQANPYDLSGGEQQKAALAKILLLKPQILLLDEPTKGIDAYSKKKLAEILNSLKEEGLTIVTVTHDIEFAAEYADRCALIFDGEVVSADTPRSFFSQNSYYTTAANRISRDFYENAVLCEDVIKLCRENGRKDRVKSE